MLDAFRKLALAVALAVCAVLTVGTGVCNVWVGATLVQELRRDGLRYFDSGTAYILLMALGLTVVFGWLCWRIARRLWPRRAPADRGAP